VPSASWTDGGDSLEQPQGCAEHRFGVYQLWVDRGEHRLDDALRCAVMRHLQPDHADDCGP